MGHNKIKIQKVENDSNRRVTFNKRRIGLLKKAYEISILCDVDIALIFFSENNELTLFEGPRSSIEEVVMKFANIPADERAQGHTKKYAIVEDGSQHTMPKDIEHEELFQEVARQLYQSCQTTNSEDCDRANQMDICPHAQLQKVKEMRNIQLLLQLYNLNIPISDLITADNAPELEAYTRRQLQNIQKYKEACLQSSTPWFDIHKNLSDKDDNGCVEQLHESLPGLSDDLSDFLPQNLEGDIIRSAFFEEMGAQDKLEKEWEVEILKDLSAGDCQS